MKVELTLDEVEDIQRRLLKFIKKVETREARSVETYNDAKHIVSLLDTKKNKFFAERITKCRTTKLSQEKLTVPTGIRRKRKDSLR